jgi:2'-hydroxyisoflavone reductase
MNILILGGTIFLGKHIVAEALRRGHEVTMFNRGKHNPGLFPEVEKVRGDRLTDLALLTGRRFDAVVDTCGYFPRAVKISAEFFKSTVPHYTFISSISVYKDFSQKGLDENSETSGIDDESVEEITGETYGALKRLCEKTAEDVYGDCALNIRPGLIVGEDDPSDRFTYWINRIAKGGKIAVPDTFDRPVQFIDVKDLSTFTVDMIEKKAGGIYNVTGPATELTFGEFVDRCTEVAGTRPEFVKMSEDFLTENGVAPYTELPLWVPESWSGSDRVNISKALNAGLKISPLEKTITETLNFDRSRKDHTLRSGLTNEREQELISRLS